MHKSKARKPRRIQFKLMNFIFRMIRFEWNTANEQSANCFKNVGTYTLQRHIKHRLIVKITDKMCSGVVNQF